MSIQRFVETLSSVGHAPVTLQAESGAVVVVLPYGGRIIGAAMQPDAANLFWTNEALDHTDTARSFFNSTEWQNTGGERIWIGPESSFFFPSYPDNATFLPPSCLDAEWFECTSVGVQKGDRREGKDSNPGTLRVAHRFSLHSFRTGDTVDLQLVKRVSLTENPLSDADSDLKDRVSYCGYELATELSFLGEASSSEWVGIWSLLQLPHGGEMLVPVAEGCEPSLYFGEISPIDVHVDSNVLHYHMRSKGAQKIGIAPNDCRGAVAYIHSESSQHTLYIRQLQWEPDAVYVDRPFGEERNGDAIQLCNINLPEAGKYVELEYHAPAIGGSTERRASTDLSRVWIFRGRLDDLHAIRQRLVV